MTFQADRSPGYLYSLENVPPLIFKFQYNPENITDKKSYKWEGSNYSGQWGFDQTSAAKGFLGTLGGLSTDIKEIGALLINTKPMEPREGDHRTISLDFVLDARAPGPRDHDDHYGGSIAPDLAILRSFMYPSVDVIDLGKFLFSGFKNIPCWNRPPQCTLHYGGISLTCVMVDLSIKLTSFFADGSPARAEVSTTLKEQPFAAGPIIEFAVRLGQSTRGAIGEIAEVTKGQESLGDKLKDLFL